MPMLQADISHLVERARLVPTTEFDSTPWQLYLGGWTRLRVDHVTGKRYVYRAAALWEVRLPDEVLHMLVRGPLPAGLRSQLLHYADLPAGQEAWQGRVFDEQALQAVVPPELWAALEPHLSCRGLHKGLGKEVRYLPWAAAADRRQTWKL